MARHRHAIFQGHAVDGDERNHVGRAHPRVRALVLGQIDQLRSLANAANRRFLNGLSLPHQSDHTTVVIGIHLPVKQIDARNLHRLDNGIYLG